MYTPWQFVMLAVGDVTNDILNGLLPMLLSEAG
jgi:hypothetical protein